MTFQDYVNALAWVGSFGISTDALQETVLATGGFDVSEAQETAYRFLTPVQFDDFLKITDASLELAFNSKPYWHEGYVDVPFRKWGDKVMPILGGIPARAARGYLETEEMKRDRVAGYKRNVVREVRQLILSGRKQEALELIDTFNYTFATQWIERTGAARGIESNIRRGITAVGTTFARDWEGLKEEGYYERQGNVYDSKGVMVEWYDEENDKSYYRGYPSLAIRYSDYGYKALEREIQKPKKKREEEKAYRR